jgi:magnesium-transporting ATPase (P-type)
VWVIIAVMKRWGAAALTFVCGPVGDGGNDVSMIQEADCGVGVEGKVSESLVSSKTALVHLQVLGRSQHQGSCVPLRSEVQLADRFPCQSLIFF